MSVTFLCHRIRLSDGHVMPEQVGPLPSHYDDKTVFEISQKIKAGEYDTPSYAIRFRRYPKDKHEIDVKLDETAGGFW